MKKTIKILVDKLQEKKDGTLQGGFSSIKGGFQLPDFSDNTSCSNTKDCRLTTNTGTPVCYNGGTCFM